MNNSQSPAVPKPPISNAPVNDHAVFKIGDLAREFGVTLRTLRFYEDRGLISPDRAGTTRLYGAEDRERLRIALFCKRAGMSLGEIREVLELNDLTLAGQDQTAKLRQLYVAQLAKLQEQHTEISEAIEDLEGKIASMGQ
ncbi:MAG: MerR family DNA-binding transcriptional regulator [Rhizobiaceae bacterium]